MTNKKPKNNDQTVPFAIKLKRERDFNEQEIDAWIDFDCKTKPKKERRRHYINYIFADIDDAFKFKLHWVRA